MLQMKRLAILTLWLLSLLVVAASARVYGRQTPPQIVSAGDVGFRIDTVKGNTPVGSLVIRVGNDWVTPELSTLQTLRLELQRMKVNR